ncbi:HWE histidine kinase domain-containing protein [Roseobacter sp. HKCCA0434]|uniref:HWE histidine kinase domain-containing protein n=1 Tax=Roseobacter sp. HKCCA0434 TaxID=3079297 RepID=UPI002905D206|nr:HWE histidine kinase domain-containing protein [Roseobacter sp. HKCCA0434]
MDFETIFNAMSVPCSVVDAEFRFVAVSDEHARILMMPRERLVGGRIFELFPETPERMERSAQAFRKALAGEACSLMEIEYHIADPDGDQILIWWNVHCTPLPGSDHFLLRVEDVTEAIRTRNLKDAIARELQHRVANVFAVVSTIARRTVSAYPASADFLPGFLTRIEALSRSYAQLTGDAWNTITLDRLVATQIGDLTDTHVDRIAMSGDTVTLGAQEAQTLSMALHELVTNALKYGALSGEAGRVAVSWSAQPDNGYALEWREEGLTDVTAPERTGFGTMLLERILPRQLEAEVARDFTDTAHVYSLKVPARD